MKILTGFYETTLPEQGFEAAIQAARRAMLLDPDFLFRLERHTAGAAPNTAYVRCARR